MYPHSVPARLAMRGGEGRSQASGMRFPDGWECRSQAVGNGVPRQLGMGFSDGREFAVLCKSDGVRGIVSHRSTEGTEGTGAGRVGHLRCGERTGIPGGEGEMLRAVLNSCLYI